MTTQGVSLLFHLFDYIHYITYMSFPGRPTQFRNIITVTQRTHNILVSRGGLDGLGRSQTTSIHVNLAHHTETAHPYNVSFKLAYVKVPSFHPLYFIFTMQTCHHPDHWFRACLTQMTSLAYLHTQARVQPINPYHHTYIKFCLDKT